MMPAMETRRLIERLPAVRGRMSENAPLGGITWFRVGGPAEVMFRPADEDDLALFLAERPRDIALTVLGVSSNVLIRDGGIPGVVIRLGRAFAGIEVAGERVTAGAAALDLNVAIACREAAKAGCEFLSGIPGTIGGALRMNAGAYGREIRDVLVGARALDGEGMAHTLARADMGFVYRGSGVPDDRIFLAAELAVAPGDAHEIGARMSRISEARKASQPIRSRTGGSTFKNPPGAKAWELIEAAGCRGLQIGGARVSELHCNFLVNTGTATAGELEALGEEVRSRVERHCGIVLEWEIKRLGVAP